MQQLMYYNFAEQVSVSSVIKCVSYRIDASCYTHSSFMFVYIQGQKIGLVLAIALAFSLVIVIGFVSSGN